jgi:uncharacterized membrane protein YkoI
MLRSGAIQPPLPKTLAMKRIAAALIGLCIAAGALPAVAQNRGPDSLGADWREQQDEARAGVQQRRLLPLNVVVEQIRRRHPGRPLDAGAESMGDRPVYRVRWITTDGRRIDFIIDAVNGAILSGG